MSASIEAYVSAFHAEFGLVPWVAAELECYVLLADESADVMDAFWVPVDAAFRVASLPILRIEKERGKHQYEIITHITTPPQLLDTLTHIRAVIEAQAAEVGVEVSFAGKPFADQPSSGLHIHLHLADEAGINSYHKTEEWTSDTLRHSLGGLLTNMATDMRIFFPIEADYARLNDSDHVPKIFGWGVNNRYCALRIPADPDPYNKRIEHRVSCANANFAQVMESLLRAVLVGLRERIEPPAQEYGKASAATMLQLAAAAVCQ